MTADWQAIRDRALLALAGQQGVARAEAAVTLCDLAAELPEADARTLAGEVPRLLDDKQHEVRCSALALTAFTMPAEEAEGLLIRKLADTHTRVRVEACGRLADLALQSSRGAFAQALQDEAFTVRFEAARGMAALKHPAGLEVLGQALDDRDLRFRAASALAELGDPQALPALQRTFGKWLLNLFDRTQIAGALARLGDPRGVEHLEKRAAKKWSADRAMAIELLGEVKAKGARERLEKILSDRKDPCWGAAARGLGRLKDPLAYEALKAALGWAQLADDDKLDLAEGLCRLGTPEARALAQSVALEGAEAKLELEAMLHETAE